MTPGKCSEAEVLRNSLEAGRLYVTDRGYQDYGFFRAIIDDGSSFISRVKDNIAFQLQEERSLSQADRDAGVVRDFIVSRIGTAHHKDEIQQPLRIVIGWASLEELESHIAMQKAKQELAESKKTN